MSSSRASMFAAAFCAAALAAAGAAAQTPSPGPRLFSDSALTVGDRISVEVIGHGPDLVFIPGLASSTETWRATAERLRWRYRLHLVQIAGFAGEPARGNGMGDVLAPTAEAIDAYIVAQKLAPAVVIGHSLGGTIALYLAEHHSADLKKALIVDAFPFFAAVMMGPSATVDQVRPMVQRLASAPPPTAEARSKMIEPMVTGDADRARIVAWGEASDPAVVQHALADDLLLDLRAGLPTITTPITVLYPDNVSLGAPVGAADKIYGAAFAGLPRVILKRVDGSRHFIMFDQPAAFAADLDAFLAS